MRQGDPHPAVQLASRLAELMDAERLTQMGLSQRSGVSQRAICTVLDVRTPAAINPRLATIAALAAAFDLDAWHLLVPGLPLSVLRNSALRRLLDDYAGCDEDGRLTIERQASLEHRYVVALNLAKRTDEA